MRDGNGERRHELVGESDALKQVIRLSSKLGRGMWPVLVLGETGTGKEVVARTIHRNGAGGNFVTIDCSALVGPLMESELFGHVKGSFTGAMSNKVGLIEQADGGTAFFDEIGELPLDMQGKLLRVLQEREYRPVGSTQVKRSTFRIIAATNRELAHEVEKKRFRQDLYYRLKVVTVRLAPLRERKMDLPALIDHFLHLYGNGHRISSELKELMLDYDWPGNIRELENCILQMVAVNSGPILHTADAPSQILNARQANDLRALSEATLTGDGPLPAGSPSPDPDSRSRAPHGVIPLAEVERKAILDALEYTRGDRVMASQLLGIGRTTLYRKLKEYGINHR